MKAEMKPAQLIVLEADGIESRIEDSGDVRVVAMIVSFGIQLHDDEARNLRGSSVKEMQIVRVGGFVTSLAACFARHRFINRPAFVN
jgi:hypothetical protein